MPAESYYILAAVGLLVSAMAAIFGILWRRHERTDKIIDIHVQQRQASFEAMRATMEARFAESSKRDAELSERITSAKFDAFKELGAYITRAEFDKRMERMENTQYLQNESLRTQSSKLDAILEFLRKTP
jgi:Spy/CpxP family protein refolding chaperone